MKLFLTGGTGFVGAHTALALLEAGHELCLLVRNADAARQYFRQHGYDLSDFVIADMRDAEAIRGGMQGCDAVFHAAAAVSLDPRKAQETYDNNVGGMQAVVGTACELGIKNIVFVSSVSVQMQTGFEVIDENTPLANTREPYSRSKRACEEYARAMQRQGHPLQITYPVAIVGPDDPRLSEANAAFAQFMSLIMPATSSGFQYVDVRDLALMHRYLLEHPPTGDLEQARFVVGGHYQLWAELRAELEQVTGRRLFSIPTPGFVFRGLGKLFDLLKKIIPFETAISSEAMGYVTQWTEADSSRLLKHSGLSFRAAGETCTDTMRWLVEAGHLPAKYAPRLIAQD